MNRSEEIDAETVETLDRLMCKMSEMKLGMQANRVAGALRQEVQEARSTTGYTSDGHCTTSSCSGRMQSLPLRKSPSLAGLSVVSPSGIGRRLAPLSPQPSDGLNQGRQQGFKSSGGMGKSIPVYGVLKPVPARPFRSTDSFLCAPETPHMFSTTQAPEVNSGLHSKMSGTGSTALLNKVDLLWLKAKEVAEGLQENREALARMRLETNAEHEAILRYTGVELRSEEEAAKQIARGQLTDCPRASKRHEQPKGQPRQPRCGRPGGNSKVAARGTKEPVATKSSATVEIVHGQYDLQV